MTFLQVAGSEPQAMPSHACAPPEPTFEDDPPPPPAAALIEPPTADIPEAPAFALPVVPPVDGAVSPRKVDVPAPPVPPLTRGDFPQAPSNMEAAKRRAIGRWLGMMAIMNQLGPLHTTRPQIAGDGCWTKPTGRRYPLYPDSRMDGRAMRLAPQLNESYRRLRSPRNIGAWTYTAQRCPCRQPLARRTSFWCARPMPFVCAVVEAIRR